MGVAANKAKGSLYFHRFIHSPHENYDFINADQCL